MPTDPYLSLLYRESTFSAKSPVTGRLVVVLRGYLDNRELDLIPQHSRAIKLGEVHELIATDEAEARPGRNVNSVANLGFIEFVSGGVLVVGDLVRVGDRLVGHLVGFDVTHMPNHMNIVISAEHLTSGEELRLELGSSILFAMP